MSDHHFELKELLSAWGRACGGEQMRRFGFAALDNIRAPAANDGAGPDVQRVQRAVQGLQNIGRWKEARVITVEFLMPNADEARKLAVLSGFGVNISRASYYTHLNAAQLFVAGALWGDGGESEVDAA